MALYFFTAFALSYPHFLGKSRKNPMLKQRSLEYTVTEPDFEPEDIMVILFQCIDTIREEEKQNVESSEHTN